MKLIQQLKFPGDLDERRRKIGAVMTFAICAFVVAIQTEYNFREQQGEMTERLSHLRSELRVASQRFAPLDPWSQGALSERARLEKDFALRVQMKTHNSIGIPRALDDWYNRWKDEFIQVSQNARGVLTDPVRDGQLRILVDEAVEQARKLLLTKYPLLKQRSSILAWYIVCGVYIITTFILYKLGLPFTLGEPVFNVIDVGFIAAIVQYTGGADSSIQSFFLASIALGVLQYNGFALRRQRDDNEPHPVLIIAPYVVALVVNYFWAVGGEVIAQRDLGIFVIPVTTALAVIVLTFFLLEYAVQQGVFGNSKIQKEAMQ